MAKAFYLTAQAANDVFVVLATSSYYEVVNTGVVRVFDNEKDATEFQQALKMATKSAKWLVELWPESSWLSALYRKNTEFTVERTAWGKPNGAVAKVVRK